MAWSSTTEMRRISQFTSDEINDTDVGVLIPIADRAVLNYVSYFIYDERLTGNIDGSNTYFRTKHKPICDSDFDGTVDENDASAYLANYDDTKKVVVYTSATISAISAREGLITLSAAPTTDNADNGVRLDYRAIHPRLIENSYEVVKLAANYYLAYLCACAIHGRLPRPVALEEVRIPADFPGSAFYTNMQGIIKNALGGSQFDLSEADDF